MKWLKILLTGIAVSLFYFPITFTFFPVSNTKNLMAAVGLVCVLFFLVRKREFSFPRDLVVLLLLSSFVSIISLFSITYNQTPDTSYVEYIRAAVIWLSGAFAICMFIYLTHKRVDVPLLVNYLMAVCIFQCVMAMLIHYVPAVQIFVDSYVNQGQGLLKEMDRLYGVGASLDVGGSRFAAVLVAIAYMMEESKEKNGNTPKIVLVLAFCIITVIGNMIARTTIVGTIIGLVYVALMEMRRMGWKKADDFHSSWLAWIATLAILIPTGVTLYNTSPDFHDQMRFGFEGFFSLFEKGEWEVRSNTTLEKMVVWPEELRTWIIGDGYFENQRNDRNYIGDATTAGYYMGTDIGYLRFLFYFGVIGLLAISAVMAFAGIVSIKAFPDHFPLFLMGIAANFVVWLKVATDLFPFLSLFACLSFLYQELEILKEKEGPPEGEEASPSENAKPAD